MDAKLKAKELVEKFHNEIYREQVSTDDFNPSRERRHLEKSKNCALIAADEIIDIVRNSVKRKNKNLIPKPIWETLDFWQEVKKEIQQL